MKRSANAALDEHPQVDLVFDVDCPHIDHARELLRHALIAVGLRPGWREWLRDAPDTPDGLRCLGSPSIVIDGKDVTSDESRQAERPAAVSCRIYRHVDGFRGVPPLDVVTRALMNARRQ